MPTAGATQLADCLPCTAGQYCPSASVVELSCPQGSYCVANSSVPTPCPKGTYGDRAGKVAEFILFYRVFTAANICDAF